MKILAIGDFHGKFPRKLQKIIKQIKPDVILSPGDFCGNKEAVKLFFKYSYHTGINVWDAIGKKRYKQLELKNFNAGLRVVKTLNSLNIPTITVTGNYEPSGRRDIGRKKLKGEFKDKDYFTPAIKNFKNLRIVDYKRINLNSVDIIGYPRSAYPGKPKKGKSPEAKKLNKDNKEYFNRLSRLFRKNKNTILISHNCPYRTKLDRFKQKGGEHKSKAATNLHYGSYLLKNIIKKHQPMLCICGHMHENPGTAKIGRTLVINPGPAFEGRYAIIEIIDSKVKVKLKRAG